MPLIFDIETEPLAREIIEATLPESIRNPVMPEELVNPLEPEFKVPDYGAKKVAEKLAKFEPGDPSEKALAAAKAHADAVAEQGKFLSEKRSAWEKASEAAREAWKAKMAGAKEKAFADAALDARTGAVRLIVLRDTFTDETLALVWETDGARINTLLDAQIKADVRVFASEKTLIHEFILQVKARMQNELQVEGATGIVGYYIKDFDLPFLARRAWINGLPIFRFLRRGRYWVDEVIDLHEEFSFADRSYRTGGLDGLAAALGCAAAKTGDGAGFAEWYRRDPIEGIQYGINDVAVTEECARKMGIV